MLERPPPRFRRLVSVGLSLLLLAGVSSPAWGEDADTYITLDSCGWVGSPTGLSRTARVWTSCTNRGTSCDCEIQDSTPHSLYEIRTGGGCWIGEPYMRPYTDGILHVYCRMTYKDTNDPARVLAVCGEGTRFTTACGLQPTMSLRFKRRNKSLVFGKNVSPVSVQATPNNSSVSSLEIRGYVPLVFQISKDATTDILSFTPEIS